MSPRILAPSNPLRALAVVASLAVLLALAAPAHAQVAIGKGRLQGTVKDASGNPVEGATVTLTQVETGAVVTATTGDDGRYVKGNLGSGMWVVEAVAPGFAAQSTRVMVQEANRPFADFTLAPADSGAEMGASLFRGELGDKIGAANKLYEAGDYQGALAAFVAVIQEEAAKETPNPSIYLIHLNAGNAAYEMNDYDAALTHYRAVADTEPGNKEARMGLAKTFMMRRDLDAAVAELDQIDLAAVTDPNVFYNIGSLFFDQGQAAQAQRYYLLAIERNPNFADAHMQVGLCLIQQSKMEEARPYFEKVVELAPDTENAAVAQQFLDMIEGGPGSV